MQVIKHIHITPNQPAMIEAAAQRWVQLARTALSVRGSFHVALSGGSTPGALYSRLTDRELTGLLDWSRIHIWFGDERCVDPQHPDSNYRMARESLLRHVPLRHSHIHRMQGEVQDPRAAAKEYGEALQQLAEGRSGTPILDLVLLGVGADGHIASLFPGSENLRETNASVAAAHIDEEKGWRVSMTLPVIRQARHIMVLASGASKANILCRALAAEEDDDELPIKLIRNLPQLEWYLDRNAASALGAAS